ncbi:MAG: histidine phosphatase family protein [Mesorhizobium sp.]
MARLLLLRHARAAWAEPGMRDFDRPLDDAGHVDADTVGAAIVAGGYVPELVICSGARRARETWDAVARHLHPTATARFTDDLYITDSAGYLSLIRELADRSSVMIVGHNPMIEDVCFALAPDGEDAAIEARASGFPASGLAVIHIPGDFSQTEPGRGFLEVFHTPAEH